MYKKAGYHIWDTWYFSKNDKVHMYHLTCKDDIDLHKRWSFGHNVSKDLINWEDCGIVLEPGKEGEWDGITLATGSVKEFQGIYYMAYTGNFAGPVPGAGLAVSKDLYNWEKVKENPISQCINNEYYTDEPNLAWNQPRWRDPWLYIEDDSIYHFVCAGKKGAPPETSGTVAVVKSKEMKKWNYLPPLDVPPIAQDLECPKVYKVNSMYFLKVHSYAGYRLEGSGPTYAAIFCYLCRFF